MAVVEELAAFLNLIVAAIVRALYTLHKTMIISNLDDPWKRVYEVCVTDRVVFVSLSLTTIQVMST